MDSEVKNDRRSNNIIEINLIFKIENSTHAAACLGEETDDSAREKLFFAE